MTLNRTPDLDWVIVGGGPHGVHLAVRLLEEGRVKRDHLRIVDPHPTLMHRWRCCTASTGMRYLRSPAVHHLDLEPFDLLRFAEAGPGGPGTGSHFAPPYSRPSVDLFARHCDALLRRHRLDALHIRAGATRIALGEASVGLGLSDGRELHTHSVVLALGNSDHRHWPGWCRQLRDSGGRVCHVFDEDAPLQPETLPHTLAVVGGGISAAQVATRLAAAGKQVTVLARHPPRLHQFDSDPGWLGPKHMRSFERTRDMARRRSLIGAARHRGSMPADVHAELQAAIEAGSVCWRTDPMVDARVGPDGAMHLDFDGTPMLTVAAIVLATGLSTARPGGRLVDAIIEEHDLPVAACGYPVVDSHLRWHPRLFVMGPLAELELGPAARNLAGARRAADRIVPRAQAMQPRSRLLSSLGPSLATASAAVRTLL
jgi:cation diffusion facilitator CzcD-associated flavoprotein CzcO